MVPNTVRFKSYWSYENDNSNNNDNNNNNNNNNNNDNTLSNAVRNRF